MGWIKLDRKITEHWLWKKKPFSEGQAWIDLIFLANHDDKKFMSGQSVVDGKRGTVYRSILYLSDRWGWSRSKTTRFLQLLENDGMIVKNSTTHDTTITLVKYRHFQDSRATNEQQTDNQRATNEHIQEYIRNNKEYIRSPRTPLTGERAKYFEVLWKHYPKKKKRELAEKAFSSLSPDREQVEKIYACLKRQLESAQWREENGRYVPCLHKWLEERPWENEPPSPPRPYEGYRRFT